MAAMPTRADLDVTLHNDSASAPFDLEKLKSRRTLRASFSRDAVTHDDLAHLIGVESDFIHYLPGTGKEAQFIDEQTIEANRLQSDRGPAQQELAGWLRFSNETGDFPRRQHRTKYPVHFARGICRHLSATGFTAPPSSVVRPKVIATDKF